MIIENSARKEINITAIEKMMIIRTEMREAEVEV